MGLYHKPFVRSRCIIEPERSIAGGYNRVSVLDRLLARCYEVIWK